MKCYLVMYVEEYDSYKSIVAAYSSKWAAEEKAAVLRAEMIAEYENYQERYRQFEKNTPVPPLNDSVACSVYYRKKDAIMATNPTYNPNSYSVAIEEVEYYG